MSRASWLDVSAGTVMTQTALANFAAMPVRGASAKSLWQGVIFALRNSADTVWLKSDLIGLIESQAAARDLDRDAQKLLRAMLRFVNKA